MPYSVATLGDSSVLSLTCTRTKIVETRQSPRFVCLTALPSLDAAPRAAFYARARTLARAIARDYTRDRIFSTYRLELPLVLLRELINQRRNHSARPAPRRPKIHEHRNVGLQHFRLKRRVRDHGRERACACTHIFIRQSPRSRISRVRARRDSLVYRALGPPHPGGLSRTRSGVTTRFPSRPRAARRPASAPRRPRSTRVNLHRAFPRPRRPSVASRARRASRMHRARAPAIARIFIRVDAPLVLVSSARATTRARLDGVLFWCVFRVTEVTAGHRARVSDIVYARRAMPTWPLSELIRRGKQ